MKTLKALKITSILNGIFCLLCIASTVCCAITNYASRHGLDWRTPFHIANNLILGWIANPIAPISFIICLLMFLRERNQTEQKQLIGKKWIWIFIWPIITTILYLTAGALTVAFTGGV